jgi:chromate transporter
LADAANDQRPSIDTARKISRAELVRGYVKIGLLGFGGVAPWARHIIVEERKWLSDREYAAVLGVGTILPGPNTVNAAVMIGDRFQGPIGAILCLVAIMAAPLLALIAIATLYARFVSAPDVAAAVTGASAAAAGLIIGAALKMASKLPLATLAAFLGLCAFVAVGLLQLPLVPVVIVLAPLSVIGAMRERRG